MKRPFYTTFAWAYDLLIEGPKPDRIQFIEDILVRRNVGYGSTILDAGCGTGTYSIALARRGFTVIGMDASDKLLEQARKKSWGMSGKVSFLAGDIRDLPMNTALDAILCRGVLNDLTDEASRSSVFRSFARVLRSGGVLLLDVREWLSTASRKKREPVFEKTVETDRGKLTFRSLTELQSETQGLRVAERHTIERDGKTQEALFDFEMRCWTREELDRHLSDAGFDSIEYFGDYDTNEPVGATDRIVAVALFEKRGVQQQG